MMLYNFGPLVIQPISLKPKTATFELNHIAEIEAPWRYGRCLIIRYWSGKGLMLGWWTGRRKDEEEALILAVGGREDELLDEDGHVHERFHRPWADSDDEWEIVEHELSDPVPYEVLDAKDVWK